MIQIPRGDASLSFVGVNRRYETGCASARGAGCSAPQRVPWRKLRVHELANCDGDRECYRNGNHEHERQQPSWHRATHRCLRPAGLRVTFASVGWSEVATRTRRREPLCRRIALVGIVVPWRRLVGVVPISALLWIVVTGRWALAWIVLALIWIVLALVLGVAICRVALIWVVVARLRHALWLPVAWAIAIRLRIPRGRATRRRSRIRIICVTPRSHLSWRTKLAKCAIVAIALWRRAIWGSAIRGGVDCCRCSAAAGTSALRPAGSVSLSADGAWACGRA